jgi:MraZ protein
MPKAVNIEKSPKSTAQIDLFGEFRFKIDAKGRVALPSKFRKVLTEQKDLIVSPDIESRCLYAFTTDSFNEWIDKLFEDKFDGFDSSNRRHIELRLKLKARAEHVDVDSSGRITLKSKLRESVNINKEVVLVGNTGHFEIWAVEGYDSMMNDIDLTELLS